MAQKKDPAGSKIEQKAFAAHADTVLVERLAKMGHRRIVIVCPKAAPQWPVVLK